MDAAAARERADELARATDGESERQVLPYGENIYADSEFWRAIDHHCAPSTDADADADADADGGGGLGGGQGECENGGLPYSLCYPPADDAQSRPRLFRTCRGAPPRRLRRVRMVPPLEVGCGASVTIAWEPA